MINSRALALRLIACCLVLIPWFTMRQARADDGVFQSASESINANLSSSRPIWTYPFLAPGVGFHIWAGKTTESKAEIYAASATSYEEKPATFWMCLSWDEISASYLSTFSSQYFESGIAELQVGDVTGDDKLEVIVAVQGGEVHLYDQISKQWLRSFHTTSTISGMRIANLDSSGKNEIIVCSPSGTTVYSDGIEQWTSSSGGVALTIAQMDSDPALEIALSSGIVLDSISRNTDWAQGSSFGTRLLSEDIDSDGMAEVIGAEDWYQVRAFDIDTQTVKWSVTMRDKITALEFTDINDDSNLELVIGEGQTGNIWAIDPVSRIEVYRLTSQGRGVHDGLAYADVDGDGVKEMVWGAGSKGIGLGAKIIVVDPHTDQLEWSSVNLTGPVIGPARGDLDGDGQNEIVIASSNSGDYRNGGRILVFDELTLNLRAISPPVVNGDSVLGLNDMILHDHDENGDQEIIIATDQSYAGVIEIYDFLSSNTFSLSWKSPLIEGAPYTSLKIYDYDSDGEAELLAGTGRYTTASTGTYLTVYNIKTKALEWKSKHLGGLWDSVDSITIGDLDTTPGVEMIPLRRYREVSIFDHLSSSPKATITGEFISADFFENDLFLTDPFGNLKRYTFTGPGYTMTSQTKLADGLIDGIQIQGTDPLDVIFSSAGKICHFNSAAGSTESPSYGPPYGVSTISGFSAGLYSLTSDRLPAPSLLAEPSITTGTANSLMWNWVAGAGSFQIECDISDSFLNPVSTGWIQSTQFEFVDLTMGTDYYYRVRAMTYEGHAVSLWSRVQRSRQEGETSKVYDWSVY